MRLKTKLVLAITGLVFLIAGLLSLVYVSHLVDAVVQESYNSNRQTANYVKFALQQALESGLKDQMIAPGDTARLMQLALEAARSVIGQATTVDGTALLRQIQGLLQQEPMFSGKPQLRVHPDDLQRIEQTLGPTLDLHGWRLIADSTLHPGGCKLSAEDGDLDASVATRWQELCRLAAPGEL